MTDRHTEMLLNKTHRSDLDLDIYLKKFFNVSVYMSEFLKRAERTLDPLEPESQAVVSHPAAWVLGIELRSLVSAVQAPQSVSLSPALHFILIFSL